jgi:hypothetical protein
MGFTLLSSLNEQQIKGKTEGSGVELLKRKCRSQAWSSPITFVLIGIVLSESDSTVTTFLISMVKENSMLGHFSCNCRKHVAGWWLEESQGEDSG